MQKTDKYIIGITQYEYEDDLFYTHIGTSDRELYLSVWGKTDVESKEKAVELVEKLGDVKN